MYITTMITMTDVKCFMHPYTCQNPFLFPNETSFFALASDRTCVAELLHVDDDDADVDVVYVAVTLVVAETVVVGTLKTQSACGCKVNRTASR